MRRHQEAWKFFYPMGNGNALVTIDPVTGKEDEWVLHHVDEDLKNKDPQRYKKWRIEDLVMIKRKDHTSLHHSGTKYTDDARKRMSESAKKRPRKPLSEEHKQAIREGQYKRWEKYHEQINEADKVQI